MSQIISIPLPEQHWLFSQERNDPPMPYRLGVGPFRHEVAENIRAAARYAIRSTTANGTILDFDPDAMVQNFIVGLLGYWTPDGTSDYNDRKEA